MAAKAPPPPPSTLAGSYVFLCVSTIRTSLSARQPATELDTSKPCEWWLSTAAADAEQQKEITGQGGKMKQLTDDEEEETPLILSPETEQQEPDLAKWSSSPYTV